MQIIPKDNQFDVSLIFKNRNSDKLYHFDIIFVAHNATTSTMAGSVLVDLKTEKVVFTLPQFLQLSQVEHREFVNNCISTAKNFEIIFA